MWQGGRAIASRSDGFHAEQIIRRSVGFSLIWADGSDDTGMDEGTLAGRTS